jgi:hypothetical protein
MGEKPVSANEMGRMGGTTRAKRYSRAQIQAWGRLGGRPYKLDKSALGKFRRMLREGIPKAQIAKTLGISTRTVTRYLGKISKNQG